MLKTFKLEEIEKICLSDKYRNMFPQQKWHNIMNCIFDMQQKTLHDTRQFINKNDASAQVTKIEIENL